MITQNGESSCDLLLSVANRTALAPGMQRGGGGFSFYESESSNSVYTLRVAKYTVGKKDAEINFCLLFAFSLFSISHSQCNT